MSKVRDEMRKAIQRSDRTRYRLCKDTGIDQGALSRFVAGHPGLSLENLETLANALGLEIVVRPIRKGW